MTRRELPQRFGDTAPDAAHIEAIAAAAFAAIPDELRKNVTNVPIRVEEFPDEEILADLGIESPFDLLGIYHGIDLTQKSIANVPHGVDIIVLYRRPILDFWVENDVVLGDLVRNVLIHEIGHHFGFSDQDMDALEQEA
jgi:predicted Zn-dependent protease with MMP-like domain